jgi:TPR repeat protein
MLRLLSPVVLLWTLLASFYAASAQTMPLAADNGDSIAIVIGNKDYKQTVPVDFAHNDADAMKTYLTRTLGFRESNIFMLKDATLNEFNQMFGTEKNPQSGQLWRAAQEGKSNIFVFYSGHGVPDLQTKQPFLLPADGNPNQAESGYLLETLYRNLDLVKQKVGDTRQVIVMIDACFTGETGRKGETLLAVSAPGFAPAAPKSGPGVIKLLATSAASPANWDEEAQLGLFTSRFLMGAAGLADATAANEVEWAALKTFVVDGVRDQARRESGREQVPEIDDAPLILKVDGPVPAIEKRYSSARDEANWRKAEADGSKAALEAYVARCAGQCGYKDKAMALLGAQRDQGAAQDDEAAWLRLSKEEKFQDYLDGCNGICAYRAIAESYLAANDPNRDPRVKQCDQLAGAGYDPDRPKEIRRVCGAQMDVPAAITACEGAAKAFPKLRRLSHQLGRAYDNSERYEEALVAYTAAADQGHAAALNNIATLNEYGQGVPKSLKKAQEIYLKSAEAGSVIGMSNLARFYEYGLAGKKSAVEAAKWYKTCADAGDPFCRTKYANMIIAKIPGVEGDGLGAILMIRQAADQGETMALATMASMVDQGFGSQAGVSKPAIDYLKLALKRGERGVTAITVPAVYGTFSDKTRTGLQQHLKSKGAFKGPTNGKLTPDFVAALKRFAKEEEKRSTDADFAVASESCD